MNLKNIVIFSCVLSFTHSATAKVKAGSIERKIKEYEQTLNKKLNQYSQFYENKDKALEELKSILPINPKPELWGIEKDMVADDIGKSEVTVKILQKKIINLEKIKNELEKLLKQQKVIWKEWEKVPNMKPIPRKRNKPLRRTCRRKYTGKKRKTLPEE